MKAIGDILQYYDSDKMIPTYGFGAKVHGLHTCMHKFAINGDAYKPECNGIAGVEACYWNSLNHLKFYGPTNFSPIIKLVNERAKTLEVSSVNQ